MGALTYTLTIDDEGDGALVRWDARLELRTDDGTAHTMSAGLGSTPLAAARAALDDVANYDDDAARVLRFSVGSDERVRFYDGFTDAPVCVCGADVETGGFETTDASGRYMSTDRDAPPHTHMTCLACGRVATDIPGEDPDLPDYERPGADELVTIPGAGIVVARVSGADLDALREAGL